MTLKQIRRFLLAGSVSLFALTSVAEATLQEAMEALNESDYEFALMEFNRLIEKENDSEARYQLGRMHELGRGAPKDEILSMKYYQESANTGNDKAALKVGNAYYLGNSIIDKSYEDAFRWYKIAADKGNHAAQYNIGLMFEEGLGVKRDVVKAFDFYKKSGEQGYGPAQLSLGRMFVKGIGTPQDFMQSIFWYKLAADQGDTTAQMELANLYSNMTVRGLPFNMIGAHIYYNLISAYGDSPMREEAAAKREAVTLKMRAEEVQEAQMRAQRWKKKTREESIAEKHRNVNPLGEEDIGGPKKSGDTKDAGKKEAPKIKVTTKTDKEEMVVAAGIARRDLNNAVRNNDFTAIVATLTEKANNGDEVAMLALGDLYALGQGMDQDMQSAFNWYNKAAEKNNAIALFKVGPMYCEGNPVEPDLSQCYKYFLLAKRFADEDSLAPIQETLSILDENFEEALREMGKKLAEEWDNRNKAQAAAEATPAQKDSAASKEKGGVISNIKSKIFKSSDEGEDENVVISKPAEKEAKKAEPKKAEPKKEEKKPEKKSGPEDDFFSSLD